MGRREDRLVDSVYKIYEARRSGILSDQFIGVSTEEF